MSAILSTEDNSEVMQNIANKTSSQFFQIPPVPNKSSEKGRDEHSQSGEVDGERIFQGNIKSSSKKNKVLAFTSD